MTLDRWILRNNPSEGFASDKEETILLPSPSCFSEPSGLQICAEQPLSPHRTIVTTKKRKVDERETSSQRKFFNEYNAFVNYGLGDYVPFEFFARYEAAQYRSPLAVQLSDLPFALETLRTRDIAALGTVAGDLKLISSKPEEFGTPIGFSKTYHQCAIRDITVTFDDRIMATCADDAVKMLDIETSKLLQESHPGDDVGFRRAINFEDKTSLFVVSTQGGNIYLIDSRTQNTVRCIDAAHSRKLAKNQKTVGSVTALTCSQDKNVFASASSLNKTVKLWDLRYSSKSVAEAKPEGDGGITSLVQEGPRIWALARDSSVFSINGSTGQCINYLTPLDLKISSFYPQIELVPGSANLLACGGENGVTLLTPPNLETSYKMLNLDGEVSLRGHLGPVTKVKWHKHSGVLITVAEDSTCRYWMWDQDFEPLNGDFEFGYDNTEGKALIIK